MKMLDYKTRMVELAGEINAEMPRFVVNKVQDGLNRHRRSVAGSRVLILGVAYKREIDDIRESPALDVIRLLEERGAEIRYHDPFVPVLDEDGVHRTSVELTDEELRAADCVVITTDHSAVDYERVVRLARRVVDTRNATRGIDGGDIVGLGGTGNGGAASSALTLAAAGG
jgi:UDP-N-acetyl-D-glucosamine dehydrogenase